MTQRFRVRFAIFAAALYPACQLLAAISITPTSNADTLADALVAKGAGITVTNATLSANVGFSGELPSGTFAVSAPPDTYTFTVGGIVLSTGDVSLVGTGPDTTPCIDADPCLTYGYFVLATDPQELLLDPITGGGFTHYDVAQLDLEFDVDQGVDTIYFRLAFGSDEYPVYFESPFNDGFGLYLNGTNYAFVDALPINISHPNTVFWPGTELNGLVLDDGAPAFTVALPVTGGSTGNLLQLIVGDASDAILDTAIYIAALGTELPPGAIFFSSFSNPCTTGWSSDVGFVPVCKIAPSDEARAAAQAEAVSRRGLVLDRSESPQR